MKVSCYLRVKKGAPQIGGNSTNFASYSSNRVLRFVHVTLPGGAPFLLQGETETMVQLTEVYMPTLSEMSACES